MGLATIRLMTAMVTPFTDDSTTISYPRLKTLINYLIEHGTQAIVVGGTTGESATLSNEEKLQLYQKTVEYVANRVPIIAGVGTNDTKTTLDFVAQVDKIAGIEAYLVVTPYYNRPSQAGLVAHFTEVAKASQRPLILYNVPTRTGINLSVETTIQLSKIENIIGTKECGPPDVLAEIMEQTAQDFLVYSGDDDHYLSALCMGATGLISVASHLFGTEFQQIHQLIEQGNIQQAANLFRPLLPKCQALFTVASSPAPVKALLNDAGIMVGGTRLPMLACTNEELQQLLKIMK